MTCLKNKILISYYFYPTTPDKVIKIIKCFYNNKSSSPESLLTQLLKNCPDALSSLKSRLVNVSFTTGEVPKLCKIANIIWLIALIVHLYSYSTHLLKYLKNVFKSFFTQFLGKIILFLSVSLALGQVILLIIQQQISLKVLKITLIMTIMCAVHLYILHFSAFIKPFDTVDHQILLKNFTITVLAHNQFRSYLSNLQ